MTTATPAAPAHAREDLGTARITVLGLLKSEWTKFRSSRSLWITLAAAFALVIGVTVYLIIDGTMLSSEEAGDIPFGFTSIYPVGMIVLVIAGILTITSEYASGSIHSSMVAAPRRTGVLLAKTAVVTGLTVTLSILTSVLLYTVLQMAGTVPSAQGMSLFHPDMFWGVLGATLTLPVGTLLGVALGGLVRNAAAAICLFFGVFQIGPQLFPAFLPEGIAGLADYMPLAAVDVVRSGGLATEPYDTATAVIVLLAWLTVIGGSTWALLKRRDV